MTLTNPTNHKVYFKIKTTAPRRYCVRPNAGFITPKNKVQIAVTLQAFDFEPTEKNKHKFMVQAIIAPDDENDEEYFDVWKDTNPNQVMESKLKCVFMNPVTYTTAAKTTSTTTKSEVNTNNGKNKGVGDTVKSSPKILGEAEEKLLKAAQEVNQLRVEESTLRQENLQLKEDLLKLKNAALGNDASLAAARGLIPRNNLAGSRCSISRNKSQFEKNAILIAIVMVIVGYLLGKMF
ncbi:VAMP-associated protein 33kDa isoform X2 [Nomia melanderi]|uniref:VAMP-associated protein 33kDa isoform X2 n=1 Tax=Nomia melanderi TaxID=2448451 RepID=UPI0013042A77|nr:vesicle-associated membrane protein-associated protein B-like [Nomia melanderi]